MTASPNRLPPEAMAELLPDPEAYAFRTEILPRWSRLFERVRQAREIEEQVLAEYARLLVDTVQWFGARWLDIMRHVASRGMRDLFEAEENCAREPDRRFQLRQLQYALNVYAEVQEAAAIEIERLPRESAAQLLSEMSPAQALASAADRLFLRWQIDLFLAIDSSERDLDELRFWSDRAVLGARQMRAALGRNPSLAMRAEVARHEARNAWRDWDADDVEHEVAPWPESQ